MALRTTVPQRFSLIVLASFFGACSSLLGQEIWPGLELGPYGVGYMALHEYDYSRTFRPQYDYFGNRTGGEIARPVAMSIWYPTSETTAGRPLQIRAYYDATATETVFDDPDQATLDASLEELSRILTMEFGVSDDSRPGVLVRLDSVFSSETVARGGAPPAEGPFPLVLHLPGYNASPSHHYPLFEYLASHGYVVLAIPNMGAYSRTIDHEGMSMEVQARDLEFAYSQARGLPFVDAGRVATTGMSWGGMSNVLFGSRDSYVDAVVTFDGAITMPEELDLLENVPGFELGSLRAAYLQLMVAPEEATFRPKDLRFWDALRYSDAQMLQFGGVNHDAFAPGYLRLKLLAERDRGRVEYLEEFTRVLSHYTLAFLDAHLKGDSAAGHFLAADPESNGVPVGMVVRTDSKGAMRPPPSREEFVAILNRLGVPAAEEVYLEVKETHPDVQLVTSPVMGPLFMSAMQAEDLDQALAIGLLWARAMPEDVGPLFSLGRVYTERGEKEEAIRAYRRILEIAPDHPSAENARAAIRALGGGSRPTIGESLTR